MCISVQYSTLTIKLPHLASILDGRSTRKYNQYIISQYTSMIPLLLPCKIQQHFFLLTFIVNLALVFYLNPQCGSLHVHLPGRSGRATFVSPALASHGLPRTCEVPGVAISAVCHCHHNTVVFNLPLSRR